MNADILDSQTGAGAFTEGARMNVRLSIRRYTKVRNSSGGAQGVPMKNPNHPGGIIRDCLDELGVSVTAGAKAMGVTRTALSRVINRRAGVSVEMAVRLEKAIGSTAGFWLRLQLNYDLAQVQMLSGGIHARRLGASVQLAL
jgi:antitoxin HigA-1